MNLIKVRRVVLVRKSAARWSNSFMYTSNINKYVCTSTVVIFIFFKLR